MNETAVYYQKLHADAQVPEYAHPTDAASDLRIIEDCTIEPMKRALVGTGLAMAIAPGLEGQIRPRSGNAWKKGLTVINSPGTIDSSYRGEIKIALINLGEETIELKKGDRVAQMKIAPVIKANFVESSSLEETVRGSGGFGHTGIR